MKNQILMVAIIIVLLQSCANTTKCYQLYETQSDNVTLNNDKVFYENNDVKVTYNFWGEYGNSSFLFFNKTDKDLYVDLSNSHLIVNGVARTYFQNRRFSEGHARTLRAGNEYSSSKTKGSTNSFGTGVSFDGLNSSSGTSFANSQSVGVSSSVGYSIEASNELVYIEEKVIIIPPHSSKVFDGFILQSALYSNCDFLLGVTGNKVESSTFEKENAPLHIENCIQYTLNGTAKKISNTFWVSKISNYTSAKFLEYKRQEFCGEKGDYNWFFTEVAPNSFYIPYTGTYTKTKRNTSAKSRSNRKPGHK